MEAFEQIYSQFRRNILIKDFNFNFIGKTQKKSISSIKKIFRQLLKLISAHFVLFNIKKDFLLSKRLQKINENFFDDFPSLTRDFRNVEALSEGRFQASTMSSKSGQQCENCADYFALWFYYTRSVYGGEALKAFDDSPRFLPSIIVEYAAANSFDNVKLFSRFPPFEAGLLINFSIICFHISFVRSLTRQQRRERSREKGKALIESADRLRILWTAEKRPQHVYTATNFAPIARCSYSMVDWFWNCLHCCSRASENRCSSLSAHFYQPHFMYRFSWAAFRVLQGINLANGKSAS